MMFINLDTSMMGMGRFPLGTLVPLAADLGFRAVQ